MYLFVICIWMKHLQQSKFKTFIAYVLMTFYLRKKKHTNLCVLIWYYHIISFFFSTYLLCYIYLSLTDLYIVYLSLNILFNHYIYSPIYVAPLPHPSINTTHVPFKHILLLLLYLSCIFYSLCSYQYTI